MAIRLLHQSIFTIAFNRCVAMPCTFITSMSSGHYATMRILEDKKR
jgi:hypothetical protein